VDKQPFVRIFGVEYELNAQVAVINAFSGHADQNELVDFVLRCQPSKCVYLVHGDEDQSRALLQVLAQRGINAYLPVKDEEVQLN
jgi:metallo-beta-lactamase family protein